MEKKEEWKKKDPKTSWSQVAKSGQMKATSTLTSTSGSSFTGAAAGGAWTSSGTARWGSMDIFWGCGRRSMDIFWGCGQRSMGNFCVPAACLAITDSVQVLPQKSGSESWKCTSTGAGGGGAWTSSWDAGGGAWASSERPVPPAWPSRTPYKSVPQRWEPESWKPTKTNEQSSHRVPFEMSSWNVIKIQTGTLWPRGTFTDARSASSNSISIGVVTVHSSKSHQKKLTNTFCSFFLFLLKSKIKSIFY